MVEALKKEPYRLFFPVGILSGILAILFWVAFKHNLIGFYPRVSHANTMYFAFMWAFVIGFLMTAVPRMTGTDKAHGLELFIGCALIIVQNTFNILNYSDYAVFTFILQLFALIFFVGRRVLKAGRIPFEGFIFMPFAFLQALHGIYLGINQNFESMHLFAGEAFLINLIFGVGSRLIPALSRVPGGVLPKLPQPITKYKQYFALAILLNLSFIFQNQFERASLLLRLLVVVYFSVEYFKMFKKPTTLGALGIGLKIGLLFIIAGYAIKLFNFSNIIATNHLVYIGGLLLVTIMVATRVSLAHGQSDLNYEIKSKELVLVVTTISIAAIFRFLAQSEITGFSITVSTYVLLLGLFIWFSRFLLILKKLNTPDPNRPKNSC